MNLLLNRASGWLGIDSFLPYERKVVIHNKTAKSIAVRIPRWADKKALASRSSGREVTPFFLCVYRPVACQFQHIGYLMPGILNRPRRK